MQSGEFDDALSFYLKSTFAVEPDEPQPCYVFFTDLMHAYNQAGHFDKVHKLFNRV